MAHPRIEPLKKLLAMDPTDEVAWFGLGKAYMEDGTYTEAVAALRRCVEVKPTYSAAFLALAQSLKELGQVEDCRVVCMQGIAVSTKNGDMMVTRSLESLLQGLGGPVAPP